MAIYMVIIVFFHKYFNYNIVTGAVPALSIRAGVPPVSVRAGVPPVSVRVIVRSAHSAPVRKLYYPRSLFIVYTPSVRLRDYVCAVLLNNHHT